MLYVTVGNQGWSVYRGHTRSNRQCRPATNNIIDVPRANGTLPVWHCFQTFAVSSWSPVFPVSCSTATPDDPLLCRSAPSAWWSYPECCWTRDCLRAVSSTSCDCWCVNPRRLTRRCAAPRASYVGQVCSSGCSPRLPGSSRVCSHQWTAQWLEPGAWRYWYSRTEMAQLAVYGHVHMYMGYGGDLATRWTWHKLDKYMCMGNFKL